MKLFVSRKHPLFFPALALLAALGTGIGYAAHAYGADDDSCCAKGAACCKPGAPCCKGHDHS